MTIQEACHIIQVEINDKNSNGDSWYSLSFSSQPNEQEDGSFKDWYRADCGYMVTGDWEYTIESALVALAKRLRK